MLSKHLKNYFQRQETYKLKASINKKVGGCNLIKKLGQGGMGSVYMANQLSMDRVVALKILAPEFTRDKEKRERFLKEAKTSAKLHHPNIISVHGAGFDNGICYYLMEYLEGGSVEDLLKKKGILSEERTLEIAYQVALALQHAHQNNLVHRDIKPDNFMVTENGSIKVCDLGLAKILDSGDASMTQEGTFLGTPYFTSPEQAKGELNIDIRADLYSLGASLFYLSTGKHLFESDSPIGVISMHLNDEPALPSELNPLLSKGFDQLVLDLVEKKPSDRFQTPDELLEEIEKILKRYHKDNSLFRTTARTRAVTKDDVRSIPTKSTYLMPIIIGILSLVVAVGVISIVKSGGEKKPVVDTSSSKGPSFSEIEFEKDRTKFILLLKDKKVSLATKRSQFDQISSIYIKSLSEKVNQLHSEMLSVLNDVGAEMSDEYLSRAFQRSEKFITQQRFADAYQEMINAGLKRHNVGLDMVKKATYRKLDKKINQKRISLNSLLQKKVLPIKSKFILNETTKLRDRVLRNKKDQLFLTQLNQAIKFFLTGEKPKNNRTSKKPKGDDGRSPVSQGVKKFLGGLKSHLKNKQLVEFMKEVQKNISEVRKNKDLIAKDYPEVDLAYKSIDNVYAKLRVSINDIFMGAQITIGGQKNTIIDVKGYHLSLLNENKVKVEVPFDQLPVEVIMNFTANLNDFDQQLKLHGGVYSILAGDKSRGEDLLKKAKKSDVAYHNKSISLLSK